MAEPLHIKHRPQVIEDVVGNASVVKSFANTLKGKQSQAYLLCGPSGVGKTTLARIGARMYGCIDKNILEMDAAMHTGVDDIRDIRELLRYRPFGESEFRAIIVDEAHALSRQAWQSLLKAIEEPPAFLVWFFCTTEAGKVPPTIKTRCASFLLKDVGDKELGGLFDYVCEQEKIDLPGDVGDVIIRQAKGSPRQLLVNLAVCRKAKTRQEAAQILTAALETDAVLELCRFLMKGGSWGKVMTIMQKLQEDNPESVRIVVVNYLGAVLKNSKTDREACHALQILEAFSQPYNQSEQMAPLFLSVGRALFNGGQT